MQKKDDKKRAGFWSLIRESMNQTGGCCGPGEACCGPQEDAEKGPEEREDEQKTEKSENNKEQGS